MSKAAALMAQVGAGTGTVVWFCYPNGLEGGILRDKRGVGRRFKSEKAALAMGLFLTRNGDAA